MSLVSALSNLFSSKEASKMTPQEFLDKYFAPEYLNVQDKGAWKAQAAADLAQITGGSAPAPAAPAGG